MYKMSGFIPKSLAIQSWNDLKPYFQKLEQQVLSNAEDLEEFLWKMSDVLSVYSEYYCRAYIEMTCDTANEDKKQKFEDISTKINPEVQKAEEVLNQKVLESPFCNELNTERYAVLSKKLQNKADLFNEANIVLEAELQPIAAQYRQIVGGLTVEIDGKELTLHQASSFLDGSDRSQRESAWKKINEARFRVKEKFDDIFDRMLKLRHQMAINAGFENYRDYAHIQKERFDYTPEQCFDFHESIKSCVLPVLKKITNNHREKINLPENDYRPWDTAAVPQNQKPLRPFQNTKELLQKTLTIFEKLDPQFRKNLERMQAANLFDLDSRKGKAPGGYNCNLEITGMPFIFSNSANQQRDVITLMHEGGHAMHNFLSVNDPLIFYRDFPHEVAETASMSMELMTSPYWNEFYNEEDHKRARIEHLEGILSRLPWIAIIDKFQHWIYTNPEHTASERDEKFASLMNEFGTGQVNWNGFEKELANTWQKQLHVFEYPFYYIEYGIAQIGALQVYRNFKKDPKKALDDYKAGLSLGGSRPLPELWQAMNIKFDFSEDTIKDLVNFVEKELEGLYV